MSVDDSRTLEGSNMRPERIADWLGPIRYCMSQLNPHHIVAIGAGAAGLVAARELTRAGKRVTLLEARDRCGGRIYPLPAAEFGYAAEGGAEFVHGEAPVTRGGA